MFFDLEDAIVTRLQTKLAALNPAPRVHPSTDLEQIKAQSQHAAAVYVAYNGVTGITPMPGDPSRVTLQQDFMIWIVTRSASRTNSGQGVREIADPIMVAVIEALTGWRPAQGLPPLELADTSGPAYGEGFGYFPLAYSLRRQVRGNPT